MSAVSQTHWAEADRERMTALAAALPAIHESNLALWQMRVDRGSETPFVPHLSLFVITALEYARTGISPDVRSEPTGREFSFAVASEHRHAACGKVKQQLTAHGFNADNFVLLSNERVLILG